MNRYRTGLLMLASVALIATGCSSSPPAAGSSPNGSSPTLAGQTVRLVQGSGKDFSDTDIHKAIELLRAQGITVTLDAINDPASALRATVGGQNDVYFDAPNVVVTAVKNGGADIKYIASVYQSSSYVLLAKNDVSLDNLKGATLAIASPGSAGQVAAAAALTKSGVNIDDVKQVVVGGTSARVTAILSGQVDLAPVLAPAAIPAVATGKVKILLNTGEVLGPFLQQGVIANGQFLKNTALAQAVTNAFIDAARFAAGDQAGYIALANANKLQGTLTPEQQTAAWAELKKANYWATNGGLCQQYIDATLQYDYHSKALDQAQMPPQSDWVDTQFVQNYLKAHNLPPTTC